MTIDPQLILEFWFGPAAGDPSAAAARESFWFGASREADAAIRQRFVSAVEAAARGELESWLDEPPSALALVVLLDQFPRNLGRGTARAFAHDGEALRIARSAIARGHLERLAPVEQAFLILPLQHSESLEDQRESVRHSREIAQRAPPIWRPLLEEYRASAEQHRDLIERFGRYPHRNRLLGRISTVEEEAYLAGGGATFGQAAQ